MSKESLDFCAVAGYDELDPEEAVLQKRRIETYSTSALKIGLKVDGITVLYGAFTSGLAAFDRIFQIAPQVRMAHGLRLVGPSGSGMTWMARYFQETQPRSTLFSQGFGCVRVTIGTTPSAGHIVATLLRRYGYPFVRKSEQRAHWQQDILIELARAKGTRLIVFEHAHRLLDAHQGAPDPKGERRTSLARSSNAKAAAEAICDLVDEAQVGIVLSGQKSLERLADFFPDLASRAPGRYALKNFAANKEWEGITRAFAKQCTWFDLTCIDNEAVAKLLHIATDGNLRALKRLLTETVLVAAQAGGGAASTQHIAEAYSRVNGDANPARNPFA